MPGDFAYINENALTAFRSGEEKGLDYFFKTLYPALCLFSCQYTNNTTAAEDIVTESFLKVWKKREGFTNAIALRSYLYRTVCNGSLRWLENEKRRNRIVSIEQQQTDENLYMSNIIKAETLRELHLAINNLPGQCKKIFTKMYIEGKTTKEIATEMDLTYTTISAQKAKGLQLLRLKLKTTNTDLTILLLLLVKENLN